VTRLRLVTRRAHRHAVLAGPNVQTELAVGVGGSAQLAGRQRNGGLWDLAVETAHHPFELSSEHLHLKYDWCHFAFGHVDRHVNLGLRWLVVYRSCREPNVARWDTRKSIRTVRIGLGSRRPIADASGDGDLRKALPRF